MTTNLQTVSAYWLSTKVYLFLLYHSVEYQKVRRMTEGQLYVSQHNLSSGNNQRHKLTMKHNGDRRHKENHDRYYNAGNLNIHPTWVTL